MNYLKRRLLIQLIMLNAFYIFFFCNILIRYNFIENQNCFHSMAYIFIRRISSCVWLLHSESTLVNFLPVSDIRTLTHFLLWNAGIDYLSVAAFDDLIPSHLVLLEGRVRNSVCKIVILPCFNFYQVFFFLYLVF
jgi:hypothetical protein